MKSPGKKAGRPTLPEAERRAHRIQVPVTPGELALMQSAAEAAGQPLAVWMRTILMKAAAKGGPRQKGG
jgi:hypothetical protein